MGKKSEVTWPWNSVVRQLKCWQMTSKWVATVTRPRAMENTIIIDCKVPTRTKPPSQLIILVSITDWQLWLDQDIVQVYQFVIFITDGYHYFFKCWRLRLWPVVCVLQTYCFGPHSDFGLMGYWLTAHSGARNDC